MRKPAAREQSRAIDKSVVIKNARKSVHAEKARRGTCRPTVAFQKRIRKQLAALPRDLRTVISPDRLLRKRQRDSVVEERGGCVWESCRPTTWTRVKADCGSVFELGPEGAGAATTAGKDLAEGTAASC